MLYVQLSAFENRDFLPARGRNIPGKWQEVANLREAVALSRRFIEENDLGSGNFPSAAVMQEDVPLAWISYNGRVWDSTDPETEILVDLDGTPL